MMRIGDHEHFYQIDFFFAFFPLSDALDQNVNIQDRTPQIVQQLSNLISK